MKHKHFNKIYSYTYYLINNSTKQKYHGVRWANIKQNRTPIEDFGIYYFTSGKLREDFKRNPLSYSWKLCWTFDTVEEARIYEDKVNTKLLYKNDWEVWNNSKAIYNKNSPSLGRIVKGTSIADKISKANSERARSQEQKDKMSAHQRQLVLDDMHYWQTEIHSIKTSIRMKENNPSRNGLTEIHKKKIGDAQRGVSKPEFTSEHKQNISNSLKGVSPWNKGKIGLQKLSAETREKISKSNIGRKHSDETRRKMSKSAHGFEHLSGKKVSCLCCKREWDLGNYSKHIKKVINNEF